MSILIVVLIKIFHFSIRFSRYNCQMTSFRYLASGDGEIRTLDPLLARQVLSQLSYTPTVLISVYRMGLSGLEPPTSRLSGVRSNRLSYKPALINKEVLLSHKCSTEQLKNQLV